MAIIKGLRSIQKHDEKVEEARARAGNKTEWLTSIWSKNAEPSVRIKAGTKVELIFLQELDEGSERYSEKNGIGFMVQEHNNPSRTEFFKRVMCTADEEHGFECWGCEKNKLEWSKSTEENKYNGAWKAKTNFYINVLARYTNANDEEVESVLVMQRARTANSYVDDIIDTAMEDGFISNRLCTLTRKGEGFDTKYKLTFKNEDAGVDVESYDLFDLDSLVRDVDYNEQAAALGMATAPVSGAGLSALSDDDDSDPEDDSDDWI